MRLETLEAVLPGKDQLVDFSGTSAGANSGVLKFMDLGKTQRTNAQTQGAKQ
jgi:hypothetical protein